MKLRLTPNRAVVLGLLLFLALLTQAAGAAQGGDQSAYTVIIRPGPNGDGVDISDFPQARLEVTLLKDGAHYADALTEHQKFEVFEDGIGLDAPPATREPLPVALTIVYDVASYVEMENHWEETAKPIILQLAQVAPQVETLQFCLTIGSPHCRRAQIDQPEIALSLLFQGVTNTLDEQPAPLDQVFNEALEPDGDPEGVPIVVFLRDADPKLVKLNRLPPETVLRRLNALNGALVMVDLNEKDIGDPDRQIEAYMEAMDAAYYSTYGVEACQGSYFACVKEFVNDRLPYKRVITYESRLFRDDAAHEVTVRFSPGASNMAPAEASVNFAFASVGGDSYLKPIVTWVSCVFLGLAPLFLVLLMVFMLRPPLNRPYNNSQR